MRAPIHDTILSRRAMLTAIASASTAVVLPSGPAAAAPSEPTRADLELYYTLLWSEFRALSDEMGVDMFDGAIAHGYGGPGTGNHHRITSTIGRTPPSSRACAVLAAAGLIKGAVR